MRKIEKDTWWESVLGEPVHIPYQESCKQDYADAFEHLAAADTGTALTTAANLLLATRQHERQPAHRNAEEEKHAEEDPASRGGLGGDDSGNLVLAEGTLDAGVILRTGHDSFGLVLKMRKPQT